MPASAARSWVLLPQPWRKLPLVPRAAVWSMIFEVGSGVAAANPAGLQVA